MNLDLLTFTSFVVVTTFTPGPNNITSASMGINFGYRKTLNYLLGIVAGFLLVMVVCSWVAEALVVVLPGFESILRVIGAVYILWLAYHTYKASYSFQEGSQSLMGFSKGFFLQLLNPKVIVYGLTIYGTFLGGIEMNIIGHIFSALALACVGFCSISTWSLFGTAIRTHLSQPKIKMVLNITLTLLLVATAIELSGVLEVLS